MELQKAELTPTLPKHIKIKVKTFGKDRKGTFFGERCCSAKIHMFHFNRETLQALDHWILAKAHSLFKRKTCRDSDLEVNKAHTLFSQRSTFTKDLSLASAPKIFGLTTRQRTEILELGMN